MLENFRLRVFREVASQASFRRAAEALYITQPAVTQQIKALEEELGSRLFDRNGGKVRLTAAGEVLLRRAGEAESTLSRAIEEIGTLEGEVRGALRVAASTTIAQYVLPRLLADFARQHHGVRLQLESANTQRVVEAVASGEAPIGLIEGPAHRQELQVERWLEDELVLVVPSGHEWAGKEISLSALSSAKLLVRERGSGTREVLEQAFKLAGGPVPRMQIAMELGSTEALLACVEAGLGVGFASRFALERQRALGTLSIVKVKNLRVTREFSMVYSRGPKTSAAAQALAEHLAAFAKAVEKERRSRRSDKKN
ncbi:MAG TPA: LysR substrate-binding domain-containing protein [Acidobacteriaceae bacterium]|nr:LysR substrate-binding domain-containing protein [Acidobacteriaceae bacterium]